MGKRIGCFFLCILLLLSGLPAGAASGERMETEWSIETVDASTWSGMYASLSIFPSGREAAAAYHDGANGDLKYAYHDGIRWNRETVDAFGVVGEYASLALDGLSRPRIAYYDATWGNLKYAAWTGTSWVIATADGSGNDVGKYASLALDSFNQPHIAYYDASANRLKYAWHNGLSWQIETVSVPGDAGRYASLALDASGRPHIAYYVFSSGDLRYTWKAGAIWQWETVDTTGNVGRYASLSLDSLGRPHIAYYDATWGDLKYARSDGTSWHIETVDAFGDVGRYASLTLDSFGLPHIAYYDGTNGDLKYARSDGASWHIETVYAVGVVGQHASSALDGAGRPYIAFYDDTAGNLKWAYPCQALSASFEAPPAPYCVGAATPFTNTTVSTWTVSFLWSFGDGATSTETHPLHAYAAAGTFPVVLTATNACSQDTFSRTLELWDAPTAAFTHTVPACVNRTTAFTFTGRVSGTAFFRWEFGDKTPIVTGTTNPTHVYTATGTYPVSLLVQNECGFSWAHKRLTVYDVPTAGFLHGPNPSCGTVVFTNTTAGGAAYLWDFGDGVTSTLANPVHTYTAPGFYTVTLRAWGEGGCEDRAESVQEVWGAVSGLDMSLLPDPPVAGEVVTFTAWAEGVPPPTFTWDFGDGGYGSGQVVTHTYAATGTYTVQVTATNACGEAAAQATVEVAYCIEPSGLSLAYAPQPLLRGQTGTFTATLSAGSPPLTFTWNFGDGTPPVEGPVVQHFFAEAGAYTVTLSARNRCGQASGSLLVEVLSPQFRVYLPLVARGLYAGDGYEPDNAPEQARPLLLAQPQRHSFAPQGDVDWVYVDLTAGRTYYFETRDLAGGADPILDLYVEGYYDSPLVHSDDDCDGYAACFEFAPPVSGRYRLRITNYAGGAQWGPGVQYTLEVTVR